MTVGGRGRSTRPLTVFAKLHLYPPDHMAGAEMMVHTMFRELVARGHRVVVWLSLPSATTEPYILDGIEVHPASSVDLPPWSGCDVVVSHLQNVPSAAVAALSHGKPFVNVLHNDRWQTRRMLAGKTDLVVFNSEWMADAIGRDRRHIIVRPPVLAEDYRTTPGDRVTLVNLNKDKGGELFWELARRMPGTAFLAVEGAYGEQIRHDLPNVEWVGHTTGMRSVYASTRVLLMPSVYESWGRVGVEAMCSGIPVIAHPTPGLRESLGNAGIFADRNDADAWQTALYRLEHPAMWHRASHAALARADQLDPTEDLARWCEAIEKLARR